MWTLAILLLYTILHYTTHYTLFPLLTVVPAVPLFLRTQSTTTKQQHKQSFLDLEDPKPPTTSPSTTPTSLIHHQLRLLRRSSLVQRDRPLLYISPFVRTANPPNSPAFHLRTQRAFASKIRAFETPALTTSLRSLTKLQVRS